MHKLVKSSKLVRTLISERAQISNHLTTPPKQYTTVTTRSYPSMTCWKVGSWGLWTYHQLCILIQVLVRFTGSYRREYRPVQNPLPSPLSLNLEPLPLPYPPSTPLTSFQTPYETPYPSADHYGPVNHLYGPLQDLFHLLCTMYYTTQYGRYQQASQ